MASSFHLTLTYLRPGTVRRPLSWTASMDPLFLPPINTNSKQ